MKKSSFSSSVKGRARPPFCYDFVSGGIGAAIMRKRLCCLTFASALLLMSCASLTRAQTPMEKFCPLINISCPDRIEPGTAATFRANVAGGDPNASLTFRWTLLANDGTIESGQGTPTLTVVNLTSAYNVHVEIDGLPAGCTREASCSLIIDRPPPHRLFDSYGRLSFSDEMGRLDRLAVQLQNEPGAQGYIIVYGARAARRAARAKKFLVQSWDIEDGRIVTLLGDEREQAAVELYLVPAGSTPPAPKRAHK